MDKKGKEPREKLDIEIYHDKIRGMTMQEVWKFTQELKKNKLKSNKK